MDLSPRKWKGLDYQKMSGMTFMECCRGDVFLKANPEVTKALVPSAKSSWEISIVFWIIAENKISGKQNFQYVLFCKRIFISVDSLATC